MNTILFRDDIVKYNFKNTDNSCYMASTLQLFHRLNIDYDDMLIKNLNSTTLKNLVNILRSNDLTIEHKRLSTQNSCRILLDIDILKLELGDIQDSSELFIQLLNLFNDYKPIVDIPYIIQEHPYLDSAIINTLQLQFDNGYFSKNMKFYLIKEHKCKKCEIITHITEPAYYLDLDRYELEMLMTGSAKDIINKKCNNCKIDTNHYMYKRFLTIPNLLLLNSKRTYESPNEVNILNTPKLKKNITILLPIFDKDNNIIRFNTIQYTLKMINVGPSQSKISLDSRKKMIDLLKFKSGSIDEIFKEQLNQLILKYPNVTIDELYKLLLDNNIIIPNNILKTVLNTGHYTSLVRDNLNNNNTNENIKWTLYDDMESDYIVLDNLEYDSNYYDNIRMYFYTKI